MIIINNQTNIDLLNLRLNNKNMIIKALERFVIKGKNSEFCVDAIIHGEVNDFVWIAREDIINRVKPLGTAHAILCCKNNVNEPFMIINADDFYGRDAFETGANFLKNVNEDEGKSPEQIDKEQQLKDSESNDSESFCFGRKTYE